MSLFELPNEGRLAENNTPEVQARQTISAALVDGNWEAVDLLGSAAVEPLIDALRSLAKNDRVPVDDHDRIRAIIERLGKSKDARAIEPLLEYLSAVPWTVIPALGEAGDPRAVPALKKFVEGPNTSIQPLVIKALGKIGGEEVIPALLIALESTDLFVQSNAKITLDKINQTLQSADRYVGELDNPDLHARLYAANSLAKAGDRRGLPVLVEALKGYDLSAICQALSGLELIGDVSIGEPLIAALNRGEDYATHQAGKRAGAGSNRDIDDDAAHRENLHRRDYETYQNEVVPTIKGILRKIGITEDSNPSK